LQVASGKWLFLPPAIIVAMGSFPYELTKKRSKNFKKIIIINQKNTAKLKKSQMLGIQHI
jgi:hypothetical protein